MEKALSQLGKTLSRRRLDPNIPKQEEQRREYPADASAYELLDDCGRGVSATVHRALCKPLNEIVAVKRLNLESINCHLEDIIHEAQTMKSYNHPNVLSLLASFVAGEDLYMITPFMSGGSVLHIMKYGHPEGLSEVAIATIVREVLKGLEYVHKNGGIHRDVKAGNILIDKDGSVKIGDFGVAATIERGGSWGNDKVTRTTFVGTPCWMAPEVMEQTQGYDSSADIWSLGITMLEMANGHAPFAKFAPMKILLMTLQNPPPSLEDSSGRRHFSKHMRDVVARCLQKDPTCRPTATELLQHKFFKQAKDEEYVIKALLTGLPPLVERVQQIRAGKGAATNAADNDRQLERSNEEYVKGVSAWNFDLAALKAQAAAEPDGDGSVPQAPLLPTIVEGPEERGEGEGGSGGGAAAPGAVGGSRQGAEDAGLLSGGGPGGGGGSSSSGWATTVGGMSPREAAVGPGYTNGPQAAAGLQQQQQPASAPPLPSAAAAVRPLRTTAFTALGGQAAAASAGAGSMGPQPPVLDQGVFPRLATHSSEPIPGSAAAHAAASNAAHLLPLPHAAAASPLGGVAAGGGSAHNSSGGGAPPAAGAAGGSCSSMQSVTVSPGSASPSISRESSSQGPLSSLATPTAAAAAKQRYKGRFQVYEGDEVPPPMSPPANKGAAEAERGAFARSDSARMLLASVGEVRTLEGASCGDEVRSAASGSEAAAAAAAGAAAKPPPHPPSGGVAAAAAGAGAGGEGGEGGSAGVPEPKKKGRFKIIEEDPGSRPMSKVPSAADLRAQLGIGSGRSFTGGSGSGGSLLGRLAELQEQAALHQIALQRLVEGIREGSVSMDAGALPAAAMGGLAGAAQQQHLQQQLAAAAAAQMQAALGAAAAGAQPAAAVPAPNQQQSAQQPQQQPPSQQQHQHQPSSLAAVSAPLTSSSSAAPAPGAPPPMRKLSGPGSGNLSRTPSQKGLQAAASTPSSGPAAAAIAPAAAGTGTSGSVSAMPGVAATTAAIETAAAAARGAVFASLLRELNDNALHVAEKLMERIMELERKLAEALEENARLRAREVAQHLLGDGAWDSTASSLNPSRRSSITNLGPQQHSGGSSGAGAQPSGGALVAAAGAPRAAGEEKAAAAVGDGAGEAAGQGVAVAGTRSSEGA